MIDQATRIPGAGAVRTPEALGPGLHLGLPFADYLQAPGINSSRLKLIARSPAHFHADVEHESEALDFGTAAHTAVLEPSAFDDRHPVRPDFGSLEGNVDSRGNPSTSSRTAWAQERAAAWAEETAGTEPISAEDRGHCMGIIRAIEEHPGASHYLQGLSGPNEATILWDEDGTLCKMRGDAIRATLEPILVLDVKTTLDASRPAFAKSIARYGYVRQAAWYRRGVSRVTGGAVRVVWVVVEKRPPYAVALYEPSEETLERGWQQCRKALATYRWCMEHDEWPAYADDVQPIEPPAWYWKQMEQELSG